MKESKEKGDYLKTILTMDSLPISWFNLKIKYSKRKGKEDLGSKVLEKEEDS